MRKPLILLTWLAFMCATQASFARGFALDEEHSNARTPLFQGFYNSSQFFFVDSEPQVQQLAPGLTRQPLTRIISEPEGGRIHHLILEVDGNHKIINLNRETEGNDNKQVVKMTDLIKKPAVLARTEGRDILRLHCKSCTAERGGRFDLMFLHNGITMSYKTLKLGFHYNGKRNLWELFAEKDRKMVKVEYLRLIPRHIFGRLVGIKRIQVNQ